MRLLHRLDHAGDPLVALDASDGEGKVACPEHGVTEPVRIQRRPAQPSREEQVELLARALQRGPMGRAQLAILRLVVHEVVEPLDELTDLRIPADQLVRRGRIRWFIRQLRLSIPCDSPSRSTSTPSAARAKASPSSSTF